MTITPRELETLSSLSSKSRGGEAITCGTCSGIMLPDPLDGGTVCCSCGRRTAPPPAPQRWPGPLPPMKVKERSLITGKGLVNNVLSGLDVRQPQQFGRTLQAGQVPAPGILEEALRSSPRGGDGGSSVVVTKQQPNVIPAQERRASGWARRGPASSLTPELAQVVAGYLDADLSIKEIAEATGTPVTTIRHWARSGRIASVLEAHRSEPRPPASERTD